jgi:Ricin-type beta-trefoil lectin domain-like
MSSLARKAGIVSLILCTLSIFLATPTPADAGVTYWSPTNGATGKCLDQDYYNSSPGAKIQVWDCWPGPNQQWAAQNCNLLDQCELVNQSSGECLDADAYHLTQNGDTVQAWPCWGGANQLWYVGYGPSPSDRWQIINSADGKCLDADANNYQNGARVQLWDCWYTTALDLQAAPNQTWSLAWLF